MKDESYYESLLDKLLNGTASEPEQQELEEAAKTNSALADALAEHLHARATIRVAGEAALKDKLMAAWEEEEEKTEKPIPEIQPYRRWVALAAMLIGAVLLFYFLRPSSVGQTDYLASYVNVPPTVTMRGVESNELTSKWIEGETAYQKKNYLEAIEVFEELKLQPQLANHQGKLSIMLGLSYLQSRKYPKAIQTFTAVQKDNPLFEEAEWLLGLTHLKAGQQKEARRVLDRIANAMSHFKKEEAGKLLKTLN